MNRNKLLATFVVGTLAIALVFGAIAFRSASAQTATPTAPTTSSGSAAQVSDKAPGLKASNAELASVLGITEEELTAAYQKANSAAIAKAVELGLITQAQADEFTANGAGFQMKGRGGFTNQNGIDFNALLADALGISVETLQAAQTQVNNARIDQAVTAGTITQEQADLMKGRNALYADQKFQTSMQTAFEAAVAQAVADGVITQSQADLIIKDTQGNIMGGFKGSGGSHGFGDFDGGHGRGGHRGHDDLAPSDSTAPTSPAAPAVNP